jgi:hypothetical protein
MRMSGRSRLLTQEVSERLATRRETCISSHHPREQKDALIEQIGLTPFSREELALACSESTEGLTPFIVEHQLPCNLTTAFLTPALRNRNMPLTPDVNLVGRPPLVYQSVLQLLIDVHERVMSAGDALSETVRCLIILRDEQHARMEALLAQLQVRDDVAPMSADGIVTLVEQHLKLPKTSRLPVLIVAAAYQVAAVNLGERALPLHAHNAADKQTGALGDVEITLLADGEIISCYEMKDKRLTQNDIDGALAKVSTFSQTHGRRPDNYVFVTTEVIDPDVRDYARSLYE